MTYAVMLMTIPCTPSIKTVKSNPNGNFVIMPEWFYENHTVLNPGKGLCILIDDHDEPEKI